jgi:hypothetical protein
VTKRYEELTPAFREGLAALTKPEVLLDEQKFSDVMLLVCRDHQFNDLPDKLKDVMKDIYDLESRKVAPSHIYIELFPVLAKCVRAYMKGAL